MIDKEGFRANVGIIIANGCGDVLWAKRIGQAAWQFPQGGMQANEQPEDAMYRELYEEVGLCPEDVSVVASTRGWLRYRLPEKLVRKGDDPVCIGQKQKWFLLQLLADDSGVNLAANAEPEFDDWQWVSYWYPLNEVVAFKKDVYRKALKELSAKHSLLVKNNAK